MKIKELIIESIVVVFTIAMLLSCSNDIKEVEKFAVRDTTSSQFGRDLTMLYSDSLVVRYKIIAKEYIETLERGKTSNEFPKGLFVEIFNSDGTFDSSIRSQYAKLDPETRIWTVRYGVEVVSSEGYTVHTELLYWDQKNKTVYSDKYVRIVHDDGTIMEGNNGFQSDEDLNNLELNKISGDLVI